MPNIVKRLPEGEVLSVDDPRGLTPGELADVESFLHSDEPPLAQSLRERLLDLYTSGFTIDQLHDAFPHFSVACLQYTRWLYRWDATRDERMALMADQLLTRIQSVKMKQINFILNGLEVVRVAEEQAMLNYLKNPNGNDKPKGLIKNSMDYKTMVEALNKLTGEANTVRVRKHVEHAGTVKVEEKATAQVIDNGKLLQGIIEGEIIPEKKQNE